MSVHDDLIAVKELLAKPEHWCQDHFAADENGNMVSCRDSNATRFCMKGASEKLFGNDEPRRLLVIEALVAACTPLYPKVYDGCPIAWVNDKLGFNAVHQVLDLAIKAKDNL